MIKSVNKEQERDNVLRKILLGKIPENYERELENALLLLDTNRKKELLKRKKRTEFAAAVFASAAAVTLARELCGNENKLFVIKKDENGKPFFEGEDRLFISLTHSFPYYAAAISDTPIGIDAEKTRSVNIAVADRMFTENEKNYVGKNNRRFFEIWTKKEAYSKFTGRGLAENFKSFDVLTPPLSLNFTFTEKDDAVIAVYTGSVDPV